MERMRTRKRNGLIRSLRIVGDRVLLVRDLIPGLTKKVMERWKEKRREKRRKKGDMNMMKATKGLRRKG